MHSVLSICQRIFYIPAGSHLKPCIELALIAMTSLSASGRGDGLRA